MCAYNDLGNRTSTAQGKAQEVGLTNETTWNYKFLYHKLGRQPIERGKIFISYTLNSMLISRIYFSKNWKV